jgi:mannose-6-phosphate isomerase-like protein (cupin superfamily)
MGDSSIVKVESERSPTGAMGQQYLASGVRVAMRRWREGPASGATTTRSYETVGLVLAGRARLVSEGQHIDLNPGDSWVVPAGAEHSYEILEPFEAIEATSPPAHAHGRDEPSAGS